MTRRMPVLLAALLAAAPAPAAGKPRWERGAGLAPVSLPAYRGSDEQRAFVLPIPFIVYLGERLWIAAFVGYD